MINLPLLRFVWCSSVFFGTAVSEFRCAWVHGFCGRESFPMGSVMFLWACAPKPITIPPPPPPRTQKAIVNRIPQRSLVMTAWYYTHSKDWEKAEKFFSRAHETTPEDPWVFVSWGDAAHSISLGQKAVWAWEQALERTSTAEIEIRADLYQKIDAYR